MKDQTHIIVIDDDFSDSIISDYGVAVCRLGKGAIAPCPTLVLSPSLAIRLLGTLALCPTYKLTH